MAKKQTVDLSAALDVVEAEPEAKPTPARRTKPTGKKKPSREGTVLVGAHFPPQVSKQLRLIAAEEETTNRALIEEALNLLFVKKGKAKIL